MAQFDAIANRRVPNAEEVRPGLWAVSLPMSDVHRSWSIGYAYFTDAGVTVIDPGTASEHNLERWRAFLHDHGRTLSDITFILLTHGHGDHVGLTVELRDYCGATVAMSHAEQSWLHGDHPTQNELGGSFEPELREWGVPEHLVEGLEADLRVLYAWTPPHANRLLTDGEHIGLAGGELEVIATPGHTVGHLCLVDHRHGLIFTGDHVLPRMNPGFGSGTQLAATKPQEDPLESYIVSLERVAAFDDYEALPGHEYRFTGLAHRCWHIGRRHLQRTADVERQLSVHPAASVWELASAVNWGRPLTTMPAFALHAALNQTAIHVRALRRGHVRERFNKR